MIYSPIFRTQFWITLPTKRDPELHVFLSRIDCRVTLDRLLVETDSPYLAPVPHRGKENQPAMVRDVAEYMAVLKGVAVEELAQITTDNFARLFHIDASRLSSIR